MLEKQIEKAVCDYAKTKGLLVYKFSSPGHASVPDRMFIRPDGLMFTIEFKSARGKLTPAQAREHERLREQCVNVCVAYSIDEGKAFVDHMMNKLRWAALGQI